MALGVLEFYAGIGGLHRALQLSQADAAVVKAFDWDSTACSVYGINYSPSLIERVDISALTAQRLIQLGHAHLWLLSPSCQPYTVLSPSKKDMRDPRALSFFHLIGSVLPELAQRLQQPEYILVENVAGFETSEARNVLLVTLRELGYGIQEFLLTPLQYGIPNSRLRYYLLAKLSPTSPQHRGSDQILRHIPGDANCVLAVHPIRLYLDDPKELGDKSPFWVPDRILSRWGKVFDIVKSSSTQSCCFTRGYTHLVQGSGSILQEEEDLDTGTVFERFEETRDVSLLHSLRLRYFSPEELTRLFYISPRGKSQPLRWPDGTSHRTKYRLIGNSVNAEVVRRLIIHLLSM